MNPRNPRLRFSIVAGALLLLVEATSCLPSSKAFVHNLSGYSFSKGRLVRIDNLHLATQEHLADGVATTVRDPGCEVTLDSGGKRHRIAVPPGSMLLLCRESDYVLQPSIESRRPSGSDSSTKSPPVSQEIEERSEEDVELVAEVVLILDSIQPGSLAGVEQRIDELSTRFAANDAVPSLVGFLRSRLGSLQGPPLNGSDSAKGSKSVSPELADGLKSVLKRIGLEYYSKGEWKRAVTYWEEALKLDPGDVETLRFIERAETINDNL